MLIRMFAGLTYHGFCKGLVIIYRLYHNAGKSTSIVQGVNQICYRKCEFMVSCMYICPGKACCGLMGIKMCASFFGVNITYSLHAY